ncbi:hypothetical protein MJM04_29025, partial [Salmonella enterica subsp. enterica serovar Cerro]|nr:hypothetical protein [Salmonella enterica subsp. enterica serovar Cerro]
YCTDPASGELDVNNPLIQNDLAHPQQPKSAIGYIVEALNMRRGKNGNQTKPKHVPGTPYWVITNTNTGRKCSMIEHIMQSMQFPA